MLTQFGDAFLNLKLVESCKIDKSLQNIKKNELVNNGRSPIPFSRLYRLLQAINFICKRPFSARKKGDLA